MIVLEAAYHGNTTSLIDISPYKHAGPAARARRTGCTSRRCPTSIAAPYKRGDPQAGAKYAAHVGEIVDRNRDARTRPRRHSSPRRVRASAGSSILRRAISRTCIEHVRAAGGVCIADEVQTGLGRMGTSFWAFEDQGVVPDIVVMGKPLGNGHPIGAVATTRAIADAFDNGMEFFSTFGGNTVSCAVGIAVLDVLRDEASAGARARSRRAAARRSCDRWSIASDRRRRARLGTVPRRRARARSRDAGAGGRRGVVRREPDARARHPARHRRAVSQCREDSAADAVHRDDADLLIEAFDKSLGDLPIGGHPEERRRGMRTERGAPDLP